MSLVVTVVVALLTSILGMLIALPKLLASKWVEELFASRARASEHQHAKDVERLRAAIQQELDQLRTLNQYEFEALPKIWALLVAADRSVLQAILRFRQWPDLNRMAVGELQEWLEESRLHPVAKRKIAGAPEGDRNDLYRKFDDSLLRYEGKKTAGEAADAVVANAIYLDAEIHDELHSYADYLWKAAVSAEFMDKDLKDRPWEQFMDTHEDRLKKVRDLVRSRLRDRATNQIIQKVSTLEGP